MPEAQGLSIDRASRRVWVDGILKPHKLTKKECKFLLFLASRNGEVCSRLETVLAVYGTVYQPEFDNQRLDAVVERTRRKIEETPRLPRFLITFHRRRLRLNYHFSPLKHYCGKGFGLFFTSLYSVWETEGSTE